MSMILLQLQRLGHRKRALLENDDHTRDNGGMNNSMVFNTVYFDFEIGFVSSRKQWFYTFLTKRLYMRGAFTQGTNGDMTYNAHDSISKWNIQVELMREGSDLTTKVRVLMQLLKVLCVQWLVLDMWGTCCCSSWTCGPSTPRFLEYL